MLDLEDFLKAVGKQPPEHKKEIKPEDAERLEIQRQRLEIQRQRLEFEKEKHNQRQAKNNATSGAECIVYLITMLLSFGTLFILIYILTKILKY